MRIFTPTRGAMLIAEERDRQIKDEGYAPKHDSEYDADELAMAAVCYALPERKRRSYGWSYQEWPWARRFWKPSPDDRVRELVKAGALIAAEIDRLLDVQSRLITEQPQS